MNSLILSSLSQIISGSQATSQPSSSPPPPRSDQGGAPAQPSARTITNCARYVFKSKQLDTLIDQILSYGAASTSTTPPPSPPTSPPPPSPAPLSSSSPPQPRTAPHTSSSSSSSSSNSSSSFHSAPIRSPTPASSASISALSSSAANLFVRRLLSSLKAPGMPHTYKFKALQFEEIDPSSKLNPKARSGHRMVADEAGDLYSFGGFNVQVTADDMELSREPEWQKFKPLFQELWKFNWRTRRWRKLKTTGDIPDKLVSHCMCYWNEKIIIYGGTGLPYGDNSSNRLTIYHIAKNHWEVIEPVSDPSRAPIEMYGQACACDDLRGEIYIVGGTNGSQYSLDVHKFNLYTRKWTVLYKSTELDQAPGCRYRHEIALYNNKLYLFGGSTSSRYYAFDELPVFDLETLDWVYYKTKPNEMYRQSRYPKARKCHSLSVIGNDCYVCGGASSSAVCADIWHINLEELKWTLLVESIPYPVYFHAASISLDGKLTVFGGVENIAGDSRNNKLTSIWLKIPSLKIMCLSAIRYYIRHKQMEPLDVKTTGLQEALEVADLRD